MTTLQHQIVRSSTKLVELPVKKKTSIFSFTPKKEKSVETVVVNMFHSEIGTYKIVKTPDWKGVVRTYFQKKIGTTNYQKLTLDSLIQSIKNHVDFDNSGAEKW